MSAAPMFSGHAHVRPDTVDDEDAGDRGFRRVACMMLLSGYLGAEQGDLGDRKWIEGPEARLLAELVDLPYWPPRPEQFYSLDELERRAQLLSGPVHASRSMYGQKLTDKERRLRRRAAHDSLFAQVAGTTPTAAVASVLSYWGAFIGVKSYTGTGAGQ